MFPCHFEKEWLTGCPADVHHNNVTGYDNDIFVTCEHNSHSNKFVHYINSTHSNITFMLELEQDVFISWC